MSVIAVPNIDLFSKCFQCWKQNK